MKTTIIFSVLFLVYFLCNKNIRNNKIHSISIDSSNCLKGVMAIAIVLHHLAQKTDIYLMHLFFEDFGIIAVGCFFFISGYGLISSYETKGKAYLMGFPLKRWRKLIVPFLFVIVLFQLINPEKADFLYCFLVGKVDGILPFSWYVYCAILFYFAFYLVFKYTKSKTGGIVNLFIFTCIFYGVLRFVVHYPGYWWNALFLFPLGAFIKNREKYLIDKGCRYPFYLLLFVQLIALMYILIKKYAPQVEIVSGDMKCILYNLDLLIYIFVLMVVDISFKPLKWLGKISYEIYLVQGIAFYVVRQFISNDILFIILSLTSTIVLAYIIKIILNKWDMLMCKTFKLDQK